MNQKIWEDFKEGKGAINCKTQDEANEFMKLLDKEGYRWISGDKVTNCRTYGIGNWESYGSETCYSTAGKRQIEYARMEFHESEGYKIHTYKKLVKKNKPQNEIIHIKQIKNNRATIIQIGNKKGIARCHEDEIHNQDDIVGRHLALLRAEDMTPEDLIHRFKKCGVVECKCDKKKDDNKPYKIVGDHKVIRQNTYSIGDRVLVRSDLEVWEQYGDNSVNDEMMILLGRIATIDSKYRQGHGYEIKEEVYGYGWTPEMFEGKVVEEDVFIDIPTGELLEELKRRVVNN